MTQTGTIGTESTDCVGVHRSILSLRTENFDKVIVTYYQDPSIDNRVENDVWGPVQGLIRC